jgi:hypothetical protein
MAKRRSTGKRIRFDVFCRDGFTCQYCGRRPPEVVLELDHIHPHSQGGSDEELNLVTSCEDCNRGKSDRVLAEHPARPDADLRYLEAQQEIVEARRFLQAKEQRDAIIGDVLTALREEWEQLFPSNKAPDDFTFRALLSDYAVTEVHEAMKIAASRHRWKSIGWQQDIVNYIWGILRTRDREQKT